MISVGTLKYITGRKSLNRFIEKRFKGDIESFLSGMNDGFNNLLRTDIKRAGLFLRKIKPLFGYLPAEYQARPLAFAARYC